MAIPKIVLLDQSSSAYITAGPVTDGITGATYTAATGTATLLDVNNFLGLGVNSVVTGFPISWSYNSSTGLYQAALPSGFNPPTGGYSLVLTFNQGAVTRKITIPAYVQVDLGV